jgi:hypothetical protein
MFEGGGEKGDRERELTDDERHLLVVGDTLMGAANHLDRLLELLPATTVLVDADFKGEAALAQVLEPLDELVLEHGAVGLVLQEIPKPLDLGPSLAGLVLHPGEVLLENGLAGGERRPGDDGETQVLVLGRVALAGEGRAEGDALEPADFAQGPVPGGVEVGGGGGWGEDGFEIVLAVGLDEDEAQEGRGGAGGVLELVDGELARERVVGGAPGEVGDFGFGVDVDVGVDDGEEEAGFLGGGGGGGGHDGGDGGGGDGDGDERNWFEWRRGELMRR